MLPIVLAQAPDPIPAPAPGSISGGTPWWQTLLDHPMFLSIVFIFITAVAAVLIKQRKKDKCLKLFRDYHVSYLTVAGQIIWGDLIVFSKGLELQFDAPYLNTKGTLKTSAMIYESDMANCLALCRTESGLTGPEKKARLRQVRRAIRPSIVRRVWRSFRNLFNTLNDAFSKAFTTVLGQVASLKTGGAATAALSGHKGSVDQIGQTVLGSVGNAYEPILERHIGKPVVLEVASPADPAKQPFELHGYLADYTDKYIAVLNKEHEPIEMLELEVREPIERPGMKIGLDSNYITITCAGPDLLVVHQVTTGATQYDLGAVLTNGTTLRLNRAPVASSTTNAERRKRATVKIILERTRHVDIICPRVHAGVHFASDPTNDRTQRHRGVAPEHGVEGAAGITASQTHAAPAD